MNGYLLAAITGTACCGLGFLAGWNFSKNKFEKLADREIQSVREYYQHRSKPLSDSSTEKAVKTDKAGPTVADVLLNGKTPTMEDVLSFAKYNFKDSDNGPELQSVEIDKSILEAYKSSAPKDIPAEPYVICPEDFGAIPEYKTECLSYFTDDVLADGDLIEVDIDETVGREALSRFGEFVEDIVYVRNDREKTDYEVLFEGGSFEELDDE